MPSRLVDANRQLTRRRRWTNRETLAREHGLRQRGAQPFAVYERESVLAGQQAERAVIRMKANLAPLECLGNSAREDDVLGGTSDELAARHDEPDDIGRS